MFDDEDIKHAVRERYAASARGGSPCCGSRCGEEPVETGSRTLGYSPEDLATLPDGADLGLGCGDPLGLLELLEGETVLDMGSGGGIDCFLAAKRVGPTGRVIGVDMTPEMVERARRNSASGEYGNVEFRLGEIEHLPVADASVDAIISNCVVNLVPDKGQVFAESFRVLKPGGRLSLSDIVLLDEIPPSVRRSAEAYVACLSGAILRDDYLRLLAEAGFEDVQVTSERSFAELQDVVSDETVAELVRHSGATTEELLRAASLFRSIRVQARKPE